ncbi:MAG TPA: tetratricopeptide repeat protein [Saprospiraceae bacterium]|nr:tetratricopeptide repeat protein [Saprospiraceae bacterium]
MTSKYNGIFNANELYKEKLDYMRNIHQDNYTQILPVYDYVAVADPKSIASDMDVVIEKVTTVAALHEAGDYVDDCYVMMAKAQFLKQDYEKAEETLQYFEKQFNPSNPYGRNFNSSKLSPEEKKKLKEKEKQEELKKREEERKLKEEAKEAEKEARDKAKEEKEKERKKLAEDRKKERENKKKDREKKRKSRNSKKSTKSDNTEEDTKDVEQKETEKVEDIDQKIEKPTVTSNSSKDVKRDSQAIEDNKKIDESTGEEVSLDEKLEEIKKTEPKDETSYNEGLLLLARTYTERDNFTSADFLLRRLEQTNYLKDEVRRGLAPARANWFLAQNRNKEAIPSLQEAMTTADRREDKARYAFIIAQIYQRNGDYDNAYHYFTEAENVSKDFEMEFMSILNRYKNGLLSKNESSESVKNKIKGLLNERKYEEFKSQIYYTLAEIALSENNQKEALTYFELANQSNKGNSALKAEVYLTLAQMYYEQEDYLNAKLYFDSTLVAMSDKDIRQIEIKLKADNLANIAENLKTISYQDSMLYLSGLSREEQEKIAMKIWEKEKDGSMDSNKSSDTNGNISTKSINRGNFTKSNFFAYNISMRELGKQEFKRKWGDRPLEDNWRRSKKSVTSGGESEIKPQGEEVNSEETIPDAKFKQIMKDVPFKIAQKEASNQKIKEALFNLGKEYRDKLKNIDKSISALEDLMNRYPSNEYMLDAYYYLYLDYKDKGNTEKTKYYKDIITVKFPESNYAKILNDPSYADKLMEEANREAKLYENTYILFTKGKYNDVVKNAEIAEKNFDPENEYMPRFFLLKAMATGNISGKDEYILGLQAVVTRYPNTPEERRAKEIMRFLKGESNAFSSSSLEDADKLYVEKPDRKHYVAVLVYNTNEMDFQTAKIAVSEFNKNYFKSDKLQMGEALLNKETHIILVKSFKNKEKAKDYYDEVNKHIDEYIPTGLAYYEIMPINQDNYAKLIREQKADAYRVWMEEHYFKK